MIGFGRPAGITVPAGVQTNGSGTGAAWATAASSDSRTWRRSILASLIFGRIVASFDTGSVKRKEIKRKRHETLYLYLYTKMGLDGTTTNVQNEPCFVFNGFCAERVEVCLGTRLNTNVSVDWSLPYDGFEPV